MFSAFKYMVRLLPVLFTIGCDAGPSNCNSPEEVFRYIIAKPIPAGVSNIQGCGDSWQGYQFFLRFNATNEFIDQLLAQGYQNVEWEQIKHRFDLPSKTYDVFDPKWNPDSVQDKECFKKTGVTNKWTGLGEHCLLIDRENGIVYFFGLGS